MDIIRDDLPDLAKSICISLEDACDLRDELDIMIAELKRRKA